MAAAEEIRDYSMTDPVLAQFASDLVSDMTRDAAEFEKFGVEQADIDDLQALGNQFEVFPSDEMLEGEVVIATQAKKDKPGYVKDDIVD